MNTPWRIDEGFVLTCNGGLIGMVDEMGGLEIARRIVACVNACAEIETEKLEENISDPVAGLFGRIAARLSKENRVLTAQRDELLAALTHAATDYIDQNGSVPSWWTDKIRQMVKETTKS